MSRLEPVIRLRKQELDELRRELVSLEEQSEGIRQSIRNLDASVEKEREWGAVGPGSYTLGGFLKRAQLDKERLEKELDDNEEVIEDCRDRINDAFQELKKFEIARDREAEEARLDQGRKEQATLDEIASQQHSRKQKQG